MPTISILPRIGVQNPVIFSKRRGFGVHSTLQNQESLNHLLQEPDKLPGFVRRCPVAMKYLFLLGRLDWDLLPDRAAHCSWLHPFAVPYSAFAAACLVKLDQQLPYMSSLCQYLLDHPALVWLLGFPLRSSSAYPWGFDVAASLPTHRHFNRMLRLFPNDHIQFLLGNSVHKIQSALADTAPDFGKCISLDTKHIIAWVKENNPKAYVKERYKKDKQPKGDPDCRLGVKRRRNQRLSSKEPPPTPSDLAVPADSISVAEFYWGYGSGVVATKISDWGEFVLAEFTQPFDRPDISYFFPLMHQVEVRLGFKPRFGAFDAAFDAFYVYEYFHHGDWEDGFAAVPFSLRGGHRKSFNNKGLPLCQAQLPMPLQYRFICRTELVEHERGRYACPLLFPEPTGDTCPVDHKNWAKKGCKTTLATSIGARLRYQLDRQSDLYKQVYKQRTATERINSQAKELGIEHPKIRNGQAIANQNTLIYTLINLRSLRRIREKKAQLA